MYQSGRSFRTDFTIAVKNMSELMNLMPRSVPRLLMSATLRQCDRDRVTELLGSMEPNISHGSLARRGTLFTCEVSGNPAATMKARSKKNLKTSPNAQQLLYTNSKTNLIRCMPRLTGETGVYTVPSSYVFGATS